MSNLRLQSWINSFRAQSPAPRQDVDTESLDWDFSEDGSNNSTLSHDREEPRMGLNSILLRPENKTGIPGLAKSLSGSTSSMNRSRDLSRSISFADEAIIIDRTQNRYRKNNDPGVRSLTLPGSNTDKNSTREKGRSEERLVLEMGEEGWRQEPRRKQGVFLKTHLPIQHALRFPGVNLDGNVIHKPSPLTRKKSFSMGSLQSEYPRLPNFYDKAERTEKDETGKLLAPAEVSHYPENNGKPKTELKDQTELGEKDGEKNGLNIESLRRVTSRSSLSSTIGGIKDKISLSMPGDLKKKPEETRLRFVVLFLFLGCVSIVLTSHILYHQHIGELRLFPTVRLEEAERKMLLFDRDDRLVLTADLGVDLPQDLHPYSCIPTLSDQDNVRCIEWKDHARLHIARLDVKGLSCHRLTWQALSEHISPQDCWPVGEGAGHWYGGGESLSSRWPLDQGHINMSPFVTGDEDQTEWGNVIKKYFINSRGLSLMVEDTTPLSVSLNDQGHSGLCLKAHFDDFPYFYHRLDLPFLNYTVCSDGNLGEIYDGQLSRSFWDGHKDTDLEELSRLLQLPLWEVPDTAEGTFTLEEISAYLKTILGRGTAGPGGGDISRGFLLLNYKWQDTMGDIKLSDKLRGVDDLVSKSGLTLVLTLNPFVSTDSPNFKDGVKKGIFVMERNQNNSKNIPALTWFKDTPAAALLDVTNNDTSAWLKEKLRSVRENMNNTFFFLDTGNTFHTPHFFKFKVKLYNPDLYKEHFVKACMEEVQVIGVSGASAKRPKAPAFVHLTTLRSTWDSLRTIIPNVLNLGVIGYPFISPGPVGGKVGSPLLQIDRTKTSSSSSPNQLPQSKGKSVRAEVKPLNGSSIAEVELFTRWWQLATFLPQLHFTTAPSTYRSKNIAPIAKKLKDIKENIVNPELIRFGREAMEISRPVIRPLWMLNPTDEIAQRIDDEFLIGDKILVAPVLHENARRRNVYLPRTYNGQGVWKRGTDGTFFEGGQWLNNSIAELDTILFFIRQPEHARPGN